MKHLDFLKQEDLSQVREYIKQNQSEEFCQEAFDHKEIYVPLLLKAKNLPESLVKMFTTQADALFLYNQCVDLGYTPPLSFLESFKNYGDAQVTQVINAYPKMPWTVQFFMENMNLGNLTAAFTLLKVKEDLRKNDLYKLLFKNGYVTEEFLNILINNSELIDLIGEQLERKNIMISPEMRNQYFIAAERIPLSVVDSVKLASSAEAVLAIFEKSSDKISEKNSYYNNYQNEIEYKDYYENIDSALFDTFDLKLKNVPKGSIHREDYVYSNPTLAADDEIVDLVKTTNAKKGKSTWRTKNVYETILGAALSRSLSVVEQIPLSKIEGVFGPKTTAEMTGNDDVRLYLLENLSSKYSSALKEVIKNKERIPNQVVSNRKKSYFNEAYDALCKSDMDSFRGYMKDPYSFNKFLEDTQQATKKAACDRWLADDTVKSMTKEELISFMTKTPFRYPSRYYSEEDSRESLFSFSLTLEEAVALFDSEKMVAFELFNNCEDKLGFINYEGLKGSDVLKIQEYNKNLIYSNPSLLKGLINRLGDFEDLSFDKDDLSTLATVLTAAELRNLVPKVDYWARRSIVGVKGVDGEYFVSDEQIKETLANDKDTFEDETFIKALIERNKELTINLLEAYGKGNKAMSELLGKEVTIRRSNKDKYKALLEELRTSEEAVVEECFAAGGNLDLFKKKLLNWEEALIKYAKNRVVCVTEAECNTVEKYLEISNVVWRVKQLSFVSWYSQKVSKEVVSSERIIIDSFKLSFGNSSSLKEPSAMKLIKKFPEAEIVTSNCSFENKIELKENGFLKGEALNQFNSLVALGGWKQEVRSLDLEHFLAIEEHIMFDEETITLICKNHADDKEILNWVKSRVGNLSGVVLERPKFEWNDSKHDVQSYLKNLGVTVLKPEDYALWEATNKIKAEGKNFTEINVERWSVAYKTSLIKFIETEIDPEFGRLGLLGLNLEEVEAIYSYSTMKALYSLEDNDLVQIFNVPQSVSSNKKIMKSLRDLISVAGASLSMKVAILKDIVETVSSNGELTFSDFVDYSNQTSLELSENLKNMSMEVLNKVDSELPSIRENKLLLFGKDKTSVLRFLRSASEFGENYLRDTLQMITAIVNGVKAINDRIAALEKDELVEENVRLQRIEELKQSAIGIAERLDEVSKMDHIEHMHDRLVPLSKFLKEDPLQPLGQDKYSKVERSPELQKELGHKVFFPRTRGDLQFLGEQNGWCVSYHAQYGNGVIEKGNILVGICEKGAEEANKENVVALAHFLHDGKGGYRLEQLKWSSRIKGRQTDATKDFKYGIIVEHVKAFAKTQKSSKQGSAE